MEAGGARPFRSIGRCEAREGIQQLFSQLFGEAGGALAAKFFYAVLVTLVVMMLVLTYKRVGHLLAPRLPRYRPLLWHLLSA